MILSIRMALMAGGLSCAVGFAQARAAAPEPLPFVACPGNSFTGPEVAPSAPGKVPLVPPALLGSIALYSSQYLTVVAPRGWHCAEVSGSDGAVLLVRPEPITTQMLYQDVLPITGPAVQVTWRDASTSGRYDVARYLARLFPDRSSFVQSVIKEGIWPASDFPAGIGPADTVTRLSGSVVTFTTAAGQSGIGTQSRLLPGAERIEGVARLSASNDLTLLDVRLAPQQQGLVRPIVSWFTRQ